MSESLHAKTGLTGQLDTKQGSDFINGLSFAAIDDNKRGNENNRRSLCSARKDGILCWSCLLKNADEYVALKIYLKDRMADRITRQYVGGTLNKLERVHPWR
jgi:hypothetical protein